MTVKGDAPDWWGEIPSTPTGLTEDRYVAALEIKEFNDVDDRRHGTPDRRRPLRLPSHDLEHERDPPGQSAAAAGPGAALAWPVHEVGRNADLFDPRSAKLLKAGS